MRQSIKLLFYRQSRNIILYWVHNSSCEDAIVCNCSWNTCKHVKIMSNMPRGQCFIKRSHPTCSAISYSSLSCRQCTKADINKPMNWGFDCSMFSAEKCIVGTILMNQLFCYESYPLVSSPVISIQNRCVVICLCVAIFPNVKVWTCPVCVVRCY